MKNLASESENIKDNLSLNWSKLYIENFESEKQCFDAYHWINKVIAPKLNIPSGRFLTEDEGKTGKLRFFNTSGKPNLTEYQKNEIRHLIEGFPELRFVFKDGSSNE